MENKCTVKLRGEKFIIKWRNLKEQFPHCSTKGN